MQALQVRRTWSVHQHPQWLVFEAEGQLQIRPAQYTVAQRMMDDPGAHVLQVYYKCTTSVLQVYYKCTTSLHCAWAVESSGVDSCLCAWICVCSAHSG